MGGGDLSKSIAFVVAGMAACVASCAQRNPSEDSQFLDDVLVPEIVRWKNGSNRVFEFREVAARRGYEYICVSREYGTVAQSLLRENLQIDTYSSSFGDYVPETHLALVVTRGRTAYASLISGYTMSISPPDGRRNCVPAARARLTRVQRGGSFGPYIILEE